MNVLKTWKTALGSYDRHHPYKVTECKMNRVVGAQGNCGCSGQMKLLFQEKAKTLKDCPEAN